MKDSAIGLLLLIFITGITFKGCQGVERIRSETRLKRANLSLEAAKVRAKAKEYASRAEMVQYCYMDGRNGDCVDMAERLGLIEGELNGPKK